MDSLFDLVRFFGRVDTAFAALRRYETKAGFAFAVASGVTDVAEGGAPACEASAWGYGTFGEVFVLIALGGECEDEGGEGC